MGKKDVKIAVEAFINKHSGPSAQRVKWPQWDFEIKGASDVVIKEESVRDYKNLWTFEGTADIHKTDGVTDIVTRRKYKLVGNTIVIFKPNGGSQTEFLPEIKEVTITKIEEI